MCEPILDYVCCGGTWIEEKGIELEGNIGAERGLDLKDLGS